MPSSRPPGRRQLVYVSLWPWGGLFQRPQHLAVQLAKYYDVLYVAALPFHSRRSTREHLAQRWRPRVHSPAPGVTVAEFALLPSGSSQRVREWNHSAWASQVASYLHREGWKPDVLWLSSPDQRPFLDAVHARTLCYDCMDDFPSFWSFLTGPEEEIFRRADVTFVSAGLLAEKAVKHSRRVSLIPNGVEVERFRRVLEEPPLPLPDDLSSIPAPRVGYYGSIAEWFDYDAVEPLTESGVSLVLVGPVHSPEAQALAKKPGVHLLGTRPYVALPAYLAHFDVAVLPFRLTDLTRAVDPVKIYEYLAAGSSVVATPLPMLDRHSHLLRLANTGDFAAAVRDALAAPASRHERLARSDAMLAHSWERRAADIRSVLMEYDA